MLAFLALSRSPRLEWQTQYGKNKQISANTTRLCQAFRRLIYVDQVFDVDEFSVRPTMQLTRRGVLRCATFSLAFAASRAKASELIRLESEARQFGITLLGLARKEVLNDLHGFDLILDTQDGRAAVGARIALTGERLYSRNPLPTQPKVRAGPTPGSYRVEGLRFHMGGEWRLVFTIELAQIRDHAVFDLEVG